METALLSMAQEFSGLPMESLIGGPLNAVANANSSMEIAQTKFLLDTCFYKRTKENENQGNNDDNHTLYEPIMLEMILTRSAISEENVNDERSSSKMVITPFETKFNLPLLTIIPLNSLAVETADVSFEMEVKSSYSEDENTTKEKETKGEANLEASLGFGLLKVSIKGNASYSSKDSETHNTHYEKSNSAKYTISVHAGQLPLPKGINTIIEAFSKAIEPIK